MTKNKIDIALINSLNANITHNWNEKDDEKINKATHGANLASATKGRKLSPEHVEKIRQTQTNKSYPNRKPVSIEGRINIKLAKLGKKTKPHTEETKAKMSEAKKGRKYTPEAKANMSIAHLGNKHSPEAKAKISAARLGIKLSPETIAKMTGRKKSPESIAKRLATIRANKLESLKSF